MCLRSMRFNGNISAFDSSLFLRLTITQGVEYIRLRGITRERRMVICLAASAAGSSSPDSDFNPYEVVELVSSFSSQRVYLKVAELRTLYCCLK